jgi:hypothetical protein
LSILWCECSWNWNKMRMQLKNHKIHESEDMHYCDITSEIKAGDCLPPEFRCSSWYRYWDTYKWIRWWWIENPLKVGFIYIYYKFTIFSLYSWKCLMKKTNLCPILFWLSRLQTLKFHCHSFIIIIKPDLCNSQPKSTNFIFRKYSLTMSCQC